MNLKKKPSSKEATFFLAIATSICREIDETVIRQVTNTEEKMIFVTEKLLTEYFDHNLSNRISPWAEISNIWQGSTEKRKSNLIKILQQAGLSKIENEKKSTRKKNISYALPDCYIDEISSLSRNAIAEKFQIKTR
ncbi:unnamed protein product [Commensalibacter communis]|uniref:hypothetical protein n=1 Tax=Commensalibacter communis TaxID=2972786 RepID=UPI0022FFBB0A|nr:hypothetical protein [Commensalibacter communis]CAI3930836.1 unnamed protein product [Commensalibacter communis]